jgi:hypothetical protein
MMGVGKMESICVIETRVTQVVEFMMDDCTYANSYGKAIGCCVAGGDLYIDDVNVGDGRFEIPPKSTFRAVRKHPYANFLAGFEKPCNQVTP